MDQTNFINYKNIKNQFDYNYKGYNLKSIIPGYLNLVFDGNIPSKKDIFKAFLGSYEMHNLRQIVRSDHNTLITYLIDRTDYKDLANAAKQLNSDVEVVNIGQIETIKKIPFSFSYIKNFWLALWIIFSRKIGNGFSNKMYFVFLTIKIFNQINLVEKETNTNIKKYISFNSAYREEAILTTYFNKQNIETITMQHGIFCDFKLKIPFDIINHENLLATKLLCWGQSTVDYLAPKGIDASRCILEGNLKYRDVIVDKVSQTFSKCLVLLGRGNYIDTNNKLLKVLSEYNKEKGQPIIFYIKKHPFLPDQEHKQFADISNKMIFLGKEHSVQEVLESSMVDFSIAVNTTAYYESLVLGKPCLRWTEEENEDFYGMNDKFENIDQFLERISELKNLPPDEIKKQVKEIIKYIFNPNLSI